MKKRMVAGWTMLTLATGCALPGLKTASRSPTPAAPALSTGADQQGRAAEAFRQKIAASMREEHYPVALALIHAERQRKPTIYAEEYLQTLKILAASADHHIRKEEMDAAGKTLRTLLDYFPKDATIRNRLGFSQQELESSLKGCADWLMERGLARYRAGDLEGAIACWEKILSFQADHEIARRNIHTAAAQLKRLRSFP